MSKGTLYIVATPIGNLGDITVRAVKVLRVCPIIVCEDTRVTRKLLSHLDIRSKKLISVHQHSRDKRLEKVIAELTDGNDVAYVSDAGTPGLSDPGGELVAAAPAAGISVVPVPGPSAVAAIVSVADVPVREFLFLGYPPHKKGRAKFVARVAESDIPVILYESKYRVAKFFAELTRAGAGEKYVILGNDLTKKFELVERGSVAEVARSEIVRQAKGEYVLLIAPAK